MLKTVLLRLSKHLSRNSKTDYLRSRDTSAPLSMTVFRRLGRQLESQQQLLHGQPLLAFQLHVEHVEPAIGGRHA